MHHCLPHRDPRPPPARARSVPAARAAAAAVAVLAVSTLPDPAHAGRLFVALTDLPCPASRGMAQAIRRRTSAYMAREGDLALHLEGDGPGRVHVRLFGHKTPFQQTLAFAPEKCGELTDTVVLLVRGWLSRGWSTPPDALSVEEEASPMPEADAAPRRPVAASPEAAAPTATGSGARGPRLALQAGASLPFTREQTGARVTGVATVPISGRWGVSASASHRAPTRTPVGGGWFSLSEWSFSASLSRSLLAASSPARLEVALGPALTRVSAGSDRFAVARRLVLLEAGIDLSLRFGLPLSKRWAWTSSAGLGLRGPVEDLVVTGGGASLTVGPARINLETGLEFGLD